MTDQESLKDVDIVVRGAICFTSLYKGILLIYVGLTEFITQ